HHLHPRSQGGATSLTNLRLFCWAHHHIYIHRLGWKIIAHPDGTLTALSPQGKAIHSHGPRDQRTGVPESGGHGPPGATGPPGGTA
ncbi:MAG TPA: HNH endonuclease, partial [Trebonia sp.]|nr:HNH endonuclease [Trebonia sp.]